MKRIYIFLLLTIFFALGAGSVFAFDSTSTSYKIYAGDIENGAGASSSTSYMNQDALGQTAPGVSSSTSFNDYAGILYWLFPSASQPPDIQQLHFRFRNDNGDESAATYLTATDANSSGDTYLGDRLRLRILLSNNGAGPAANYNYQLEYAQLSGTCAASSYTVVPATTSTEPWRMGGQSNVDDNISTTDSAGITNPGGKTFHVGKVRTLNAQTGAISITQSQFSEIEYGIKSTKDTAVNQLYCFRVTNLGSTANFTYTVYPQISVKGTTYRPQGGGGGAIESSGTPDAPVGGGGASGGGGITYQCNDTVDNDSDTLVDTLDPNCHNNGNLNEAYVPTWNSETTSPVPVGGGGQGGGGGDIGYRNNENLLLAQVIGTQGENDLNLPDGLVKVAKFLIFPLTWMMY